MKETLGEKIFELNDNVSVLKNVGGKRCNLLNKLNIRTINDLLTYYPRDYEDRSNIVSPTEIDEEGFYTIAFVLKKAPENIGLKEKVVTKITFDNNFSIKWFSQPYLKNTFIVGQKYVFAGEVTKFNNRFVMLSPDYEKMGDSVSRNFGRIVPKYRLTKDLSQKVLRGFIEEAINGYLDLACEFLPDFILEKFELIKRQTAIKNIHFPETNEAFYIARKRLVFEELFIMQLSLYHIKNVVKKASSNIIKNCDIEQFLNILPFSMTSSQLKVLEEIIKDLKSGFVMNRLIQGDVGSGKTVISFLSAYIIFNNFEGGQVALMAPTEVLAKQHYVKAVKMFKNFGIEVAFLSGSLKQKEKKQVLADVKSGKYRLVIGTHALIQEKVEYFDLKLVITDEQHRFGVSQRSNLSEKGDMPHVVVMSATPIPRTLALILYGDMDISVIDELPPGRIKIDTYSVNSSYRQRIYDFINKQLEEGRQAYIVCPSIEEGEKSNLKAVLSYVEEIRVYFKDFTVKELHGKMSNDDKLLVMDEFIRNEVQILVATTVIEVGVDVANATVMLIENAERFGIATLHQLRGRVGRSDLKSYCIMITDAKNKVCKERMEAMTKHTDGFFLSELDLNLRGPGDFFGTMQHGLPEMRVANIYKDLNLLSLVSQAVSMVCKYDYFQIDEFKPLVEKINYYTKEAFDFYSL